MSRKRIANLFLIVALVLGLYLFQPAEDGIPPAIKIVRAIVGSE